MRPCTLGPQLFERACAAKQQRRSDEQHDILTGSQSDGTAYPADEDMTCSNWTSGSDDGKARVGHLDYAAWGSAHDSRGCSQAALISSGGDGLFYCFAVQE